MGSKNKKIRELMEAWQRVDKRVVKVSVIVIVLFLLSWAVYAVHLEDISSKYNELISQQIASEVENSSLKIEASIIRRCNYVGNYARGMSAQDEISQGDIEVMLHSVVEATDFIDVIYCDAYGKNIITSKGSQNVDVLRYVNLYDGFSSYSIFDNETDLCTTKDSFVVLAPVKDKTKIEGYVLGVGEYYEQNQFSSINDEIKGDIVMLDKKGRIVSLVRDGEAVKVEKNYNFFNVVSSYINSLDFAKLVEKYNDSVHTNEAGSYSAITNGSNIIYIFSPIEGTGGWSIMFCVDENSVRKIVNRMLIASLIMFLIIITLMVVAAWTIINHIRKEQQRVISLEYLDGLTGIMNRNAFTTKAAEVLKENKSLPYYISCIDIVNFSIINETYGHERSDVIIKALADACKEAYGSNEVYGRLNADVFVALVVNDGEEEERAAFLEGKVKQAARKVYINHPIRIKRGYYEIIDPSESVSRMIDKANIARKTLSSDAKSLSCKYSDNLMEDARKNEIIESQMEKALRDGEFVPYLQAKFDMERNHVSGAEALVRWRKPNGTLVPPGDFIPLFEKNGFVEKIDFYMLEEICKYLRKMIDEGRDVYPISVNQSRYLFNDPDYVSRVKDILLKYDIPVGLIELELTETVFFHERDRMIKMMNELKYIHVRLSIDDFGSGYSSFNLLKDVPFDVLKIDRLFLSDSTQSEKGKWILKEIVEMSHGLGMDVICEGVETTEQSEMLLSIGCKHAQGFLYARPVPMEEYIEKYNLISSEGEDSAVVANIENVENSDNAISIENVEDANNEATVESVNNSVSIDNANTDEPDNSYITDCMW